MAYFISESYFRDVTPFDQNVDWAEIKGPLLMSQEMHVRPILGDLLYAGLSARITASTLSANDTLLLEQIKPFLAWKTCSVALPFINMRIRNRGLLYQNGDNLVNTTIKETEYLQNQTNGMAEFNMKRLEAWLCLNGNLFSEYTAPGNGLAPRNEAYDYGIIVPNSYGCSCGNLTGNYCPNCR